MFSPYAEAYLLSLVSCNPCENHVHIFTDGKKNKENLHEITLKLQDQVVCIWTENS